MAVNKRERENKMYKETDMNSSACKVCAISTLAPQFATKFEIVFFGHIVDHPQNLPRFSEGQLWRPCLRSLHSQRLSVHFGSCEASKQASKTEALHINKAAHLCNKLAIIIRRNLWRLCSCAHLCWFLSISRRICIGKKWVQRKETMTFFPPYYVYRPFTNTYCNVDHDTLEMKWWNTNDAALRHEQSNVETHQCLH